MTAPTPLTTNGLRLGLSRLVVPTAVGAVIIRTGRRSGDVALVLLHGAAGSWSTWTPLIAASDSTAHPLADIVAIDLPGWGESGARAPSIEHLSESVVEVVRALGYERWRIVGHSLGGFVALDIASRYPADTVSAGLVSPSGEGVMNAVRRPVVGARRLPWLVGMVIAMRVLGTLGRARPPLLRALRATGMLRATRSDRPPSLAPCARPAFMTIAAGAASAAPSVPSPVNGTCSPAHPMTRGTRAESPISTLPVWTRPVTLRTSSGRSRCSTRFRQCCAPWDPP